MSILVTGGAGFIGSHLVDHLLSSTDATITVLDNFSSGDRSNLDHLNDERVRVHDGDVRDGAVVHDAASNVDTIYHLAAAVGVRKIVENPLESLQTNLEGTETVLEVAADREVPTFVASSSEVYGKSEAVPFSEADDRILGPTSTPRWSYATAKAADEFMALGYYDQHNLPVVVGRFFNIVGPRQSGQYGMVIPTFVEQALDGDDLTVYGDGTQTRSFTHVHDAVEAVHDIVTTGEAYGEVFNVGVPNPTSINDLAERVIEMTGSDSGIIHVPFEKAYGEDFEEPDAREPDVSKLRETIGWEPEADLDRILTDVIEEYTEAAVVTDE